MCTTIKIESKEGFVLARTMDFESPLIYNGTHIPKNFNYLVDLDGNKIYSKYSAMGIVFFRNVPLKDGINDQGLIGCTNYFHGFNVHSESTIEGKVNLSSLDYLNYALLSYKNVDELVEDLGNIHISSRDKNGNPIICPEFHHMFIDRAGKCVVVEPFKQEYTFYDNPYDVMTNSPAFTSHVKRLKKTMNIGDIGSFNGAKDLPGGFDPTSRFIKAHYFVRTHVDSENQSEALNSAYNIMDALSVPNGFIYSSKHDHNIYTRYISAYDNKNLVMTAKSHTNPKIYYCSFDDFEEDDHVFFDFHIEYSMDKFQI